MSRIGFVLLTHANPPQILRLVRRLNTMFDAPPIVCHHDFGKCALSEDSFPTNVFFVHPHANTGWGKFSIVEATLLGLEAMYRRADSPDWCVLLSGACYPTKPASQVLANLTTGGYDAHIDGVLIDPATMDASWYKEVSRRYLTMHIDIPFPTLDRRLRPKTRFAALPQSLSQSFLPFSPTLKCYVGSHWLTVSRRTAEHLLEFQKTPANLALVKHYQDLKYYKRERFPEESYFQTVLYNQPNLRLNDYNWLYLDWSEKKLNPKLLTLADLDTIQASPAHFARKFDMSRDADLMDALDQIIDQDAVITTR